jgi:single-stranded DNA-specific DHH superfamily exonuclease
MEGLRMDALRERFEEKIRRKEIEIQNHENKIKEAKIYLQALQDAMKLLRQEGGDTGISVSSKSSESTVALRPKSSVGQAYQLIKNTGKPLHINEILVGIGKEINKKERASLAGSLSAYVKRQQIFARTAPNTFGLIGMEKELEPPDDFGVDKEEQDNDVFVAGSRG